MRLLNVSVLLFAVLLVPTSHASYTDREERWAEQVLDTLFTGEAVWLEDKEGKFLSLYTKASGEKSPRGVLILHDHSLHPDWPEVIAPLRRALPEQGWSTLSLQMPILPPRAPLTALGSLFDESPERIRAGIDFLHAQGVESIVIVGHGLGAAMGAAFLADAQKDYGIAGFIGVSMDAPKTDITASEIDARLSTPNMLAKLTLPAFDLYGALDYSTVIESAMSRMQAATKAGNSNYKQQRIPAADHFFTRQSEALIASVNNWLEELPHRPACGIQGAGR